MSLDALSDQELVKFYLGACVHGVIVECEKRAKPEDIEFVRELALRIKDYDPIAMKTIAEFVEPCVRD